jgi:choline dehydrogenase-like flavoprotein
VAEEIWDAVVVGSGAGGAPMALRLSEAGWRVLVLEKGPRYQRADYGHDEVLHDTRPDFFVPAVADEPHVLVDAAGERKPRRTTLGWLACCVGGGTVRMGSSFYRFHPTDFRLRSSLGAMEEVVDWPYSYADLEPYYCQAEWEIGVAGAGARHGEGFRSRPLPMPPLRAHPLTGRFDEACHRLGVSPSVTPRAINSQPYGGRPACAYCAACAGYGCPIGARGSTQEALIPRAERTGRCQVRPEAMVYRITTDARGRASGCLYLDAQGVEHRVRARLVCVSCSAVESARLLLLSASAAFPDGLANGSGRVGRHLQFHVGSSGAGRFWDVGRGGGGVAPKSFLARSVSDYHLLPEGAAAYRKGGILRFDVERAPPIQAATRAAADAGGRWLWGAPLKARLGRHFRASVHVELEVFQDFLPNAGTHVSIDPDATDRWGLGVARMQLAHPAHHGAAAPWLQDRGLEILEEMGADEVVRGPAGYLNQVLVHGTCRAGRDPATSVLDPYCRAHEVPNLFVVDGSFMPTSGAAPSTLTIVANSLRTADFVLNRARSGDLSRRRRARGRSGEVRRNERGKKECAQIEN